MKSEQIRLSAVLIKNVSAWFGLFWKELLEIYFYGLKNDGEP